MERPGKKKSVQSFLEQFDKEYQKNLDPDGKNKEAALAYLNHKNLNQDSFDDLSEALDSIMKESERLTLVMETLAKQGEDPTSVSWVNDEIPQNNAIKYGLLGLMLDLKNQN